MSLGSEVVSTFLRGNRTDGYRRHRSTLKDVERDTGVPAALLGGLASVESNFDPEAVNRATGAAGMFQIMPMHHDRFVGEGVWPNRQAWSNPYYSGLAAAAILRDHGYGSEPIRRVLAGYGGFRSADPDPYVDAVTGRATAYAFAEAVGVFR